MLGNSDRQGIGVAGSGGGASAVSLYSSIVTLTAAQVKALNATPITLVAAPGAGYFIEPVSLLARLIYGTVAYDGIAAGEDLSFKWANASGAQMLTAIEATGFLDATADAYRLTYPINLAANVVPVANAAIVVHMLTGEIATGDSLLRIETTYRIRKLAI